MRAKGKVVILDRRGRIVSIVRSSRSQAETIRLQACSNCRMLRAIGSRHHCALLPIDA